MPRERDPKRAEAERMWIESRGQMDLVEIAAQLGVAAGTVRGWKSKDGWDAQLNGTLQSKERNAPNGMERSKPSQARPGNRNAAGHGAPKGNKNALGNRGGEGGPVGNDKAVKHGFFRKIFPADEDTLDILDDVTIKSPLDILWENIVIQYMAIARAQRIMFVRDQDDITREIKKTKETSFGEAGEALETEWEIQFAWDKHASFLQAQSKAITTLTGLIAKYDELCRGQLATEEHRLRIDKLKAEVAKLKGDDGGTSDDGFLEAIKGMAAGVWGQDGSAEA